MGREKIEKKLIFFGSNIIFSPLPLLNRNGIDLAMSADFKYRRQDWPHVEGSGTIDVSTQQSAVNLKQSP